MMRSANDRGSRGNAPAGHFQCIYCAIIEPRLWNIVPGTFFYCRAEIFFFLVVPGENRECWAAPPGAAHRSYNPGWWYGPLSEDRENFQQIYQNYLVALIEAEDRTNTKKK